MPSNSPAFQWYPKDWLADANVKRLSWEAKGVYMELLSIMWNEGRDRLADDADVARVLGVTDTFWARIRSELQKQGKQVFLESKGFLVSRRLREERRKHRELRKVRQHAARTLWDSKRDANAEQTVCSSSPSSTSSSPPKKREKITVGEIRAVLDLYNKTCVPRGFPEAIDSEGKRIKIRTRLRDPIFAKRYPELFDKVAASDFLGGQNDRGWIPGLTWFIKNSENYVKVLEGQYVNREGKKPNRPGDIPKPSDFSGSDLKDHNL